VAGLIALVAVLFAGGGTMYVRRQARAERHNTFAGLASVAAMKAEAIAAWRAERLAHVTELAQGILLRQALVSHLTAPADAALRERIRAHLDLTRRLYADAAVFLAAPDGRVLVADGGAPVVDEATRAEIRCAAGGNTPMLGDLLRPGGGAPVLDALAPMAGNDGRAAAVLVLRTDPAHDLFPLIQRWPLPSASAETLLVERRGDDVVFLNDLRFHPNAALTLRVPLTRADAAAVQAALGRAGAFAGNDYRGVAVLANLQPVPGSPWFLVAKVDRSEVLATLRPAVTMPLLAALALTLAAGFGAAFVYKAQGKTALAGMYDVERARRQALETFETTLRSIGDAVITTDAEGRVEFMNPVAEGLTGWSHAEARGEALPEVFHIVNEQTRQPVESPVARVLREGAVVGLANHTVLIARDGRNVPIADSGAPIRDPQGATTGVVLVFRDQSAERAAAAALRASEAKLRALFAALPDVVLVVDRDGRYREIAPTGADLLYRPAAELLGKTMTEVFDAEHARQFLAAIATTLDSGRRTAIEYTLPIAGVERTFTATVVPHGDDSVVLVARDVTERRRTEAELRQAQKMEAVGTLAGGIAHDFNNLLQALLAMVEGARMQAHGSPLERSLAEIERQVQRGAGLTRQLLLFTRKTPTQRECFDLATLVADHAAMLRQLLPETIALALTTAPAAVEADPAQIGQVLTNLAINARDAMPGGGTLAITVARNDGEAVLEVSDTGVGMSDEVRQRIFDPFFTTKPAGKGTGLGLAVVWGIAKEHGGRVEVESAPGHGARFRVALPAADGPTASAPAAEAGDDLLHGRGERVLLIEDEPGAREGLTELLALLGYTVTAAASGEEAGRFPAAPSFDLLLTDYRLPGVTGLEAAQQLATRWPDLRVIVMSGYAPEDFARDLFASGAVHFLQKPFDVASLARALRAALDRSGM
jgi:PAS domain S-box-containing protein